MFMAAANLKDERHTVTVTVDSQQPDKAAILHAHRLPDLRENPSKYDGTNWYLGGILVIGDADQPGQSPTEASRES